MVDFIDKIYGLIIYRNKLLTKIRYYSVLRFLIRIFANLILPIYFRITQSNKNYHLKTRTKSEGRIIVSLTSFPARISRIWLVIETLLRQTQKPDKIILWLSKEQFSSVKSIPKKLLKQTKRGLEIRWVDGDIRSHKKYYYAISEFPNNLIITVDDDVFYNSKILSNLIELSHIYPLAICCNHASHVKVKDGDISPYLNWETVIGNKKPNYEIVPIGVGGILYPPNSLYKDVLNVDIFKKHCLLADDIWLNVMARLQGTEAAKTDYNSGYLPIININNSTLNSKNINEGLNDIQLKSIRNYYISTYGIDPYKEIITNIE
jgi:hypothetical protein